ncbi:AraC family transcriptional regulator [Paenibacillus sp. GCM10023252]|uniref:AraC family transcriptional regulator n=1 Tax=Paenibacillus sp. GCM10023252 TaxID=3252649 RepID=UPI00361B813D
MGDRSTREVHSEYSLLTSCSFPLTVRRGQSKAEEEESLMDCHWHPEAEWFFVMEGELLFQVDTECFRVAAGEAVFLDGGEVHAAYSISGTACAYCSIVFNPSMLTCSIPDLIEQTIVSPLQQRKRTFPRHVKGIHPWEQQIVHFIRLIMEADESKNTCYEAAIKGYLFLMLPILAADGCSVNRSQPQPAEQDKMLRLKQVIQHMQLHYTRTIRSAELAELVRMSEGQFCRFFKSMTRKTPIEYLNAYRVMRAAELLRGSSRKISDIAADVGFDHNSYFVRVFRKATGYSPTQFRKAAIGTSGE